MNLSHQEEPLLPSSINTPTLPELHISQSALNQHQIPSSYMQNPEFHSISRFIVNAILFILFLRTLQTFNFLSLFSFHPILMVSGLALIVNGMYLSLDFPL